MCWLDSLGMPMTAMVAAAISTNSLCGFAYLKRTRGLIGSESLIRHIVCSKQTLHLDCLQMDYTKMPIKEEEENFYKYQKLVKKYFQSVYFFAPVPVRL